MKPNNCVMLAIVFTVEHCIYQNVWLPISILDLAKTLKKFQITLYLPLLRNNTSLKDEKFQKPIQGVLNLLQLKVLPVTTFLSQEQRDVTYSLCCWALHQKPCVLVLISQSWFLSSFWFSSWTKDWTSRSAVKLYLPIHAVAWTNSNQAYYVSLYSIVC